MGGDVAGSSPADNGLAPPVTEGAANTDVTPVSTSSPEATGESEPNSTLDAVVAALHPKEKAEADPPSAQTEGQKPPEPLEEEPLPEEVTDEELRDTKPKTARRIRQLLAEKAERDGTIAELRPKAEAIDELHSFLQSSGVSVDDLNAGIEIMALLRHDPLKALEKLTPTVQALQQFAGQVLPPDLDEKVRQGFIDEPTARELASRRQNDRFQTQRAEETRRQNEAEKQRQAAERFQSQVTTTGNEWQKTKMAGDPDWAAKAPRVLELIELEVYRQSRQGKAPRQTQEVVDICERAYKQASDELRKRQPPPSPVKPPPTGTPSQSVEAEPKNFLDAVRQGIRAAHA